MSSLFKEIIKEEVEAYQNAINDVAIIAITDVKGNIIHVNQKFCDISGYTKEELIGKNHRILKSDYHSEGFFKSMWKQIANGKKWRGEIRNRKKNGEYYWVDTIIVPILNEFNKPKQYLALRFDITKKKKLETIALHSHKDKIELKKFVEVNNFKNNLIHTLSHDVKSPFKSLLGLINLLEIDLINNNDFIYHLSEVKEKIHKVEKIHDELILSAQINSNQKHIEIVDLNELVESIKEFFCHQIIQKNIKINKCISTETVVFSNPEILRLIIKNIISNAIKYSHFNGTIDINITSPASVNKIEFTVRDYGHGMTQETLRAIKTSTLSLRNRKKPEEDRIPGMGLILSKQFIHDALGQFIIKSEVGKGSTVGFCIPTYNLE